MKKDTIYREDAIEAIRRLPNAGIHWYASAEAVFDALFELPSAHEDHIADGNTKVNVENKYEYHYDHTDCIWYRPEARNRCPSTCAQYRDGWNDAMNYIFRDGKGYRPFRRDKKYEE